MKYWLMKSEPDVFSFEDLKKRKNQTEPWNGVRNYQARNFMRDEMKKGDMILFYHSSCPIPGVAGIARVNSEAYPDSTQFDPKSEYFDPKATKENPRWFLVDVSFEMDLDKHVSLEELKEQKKLSEMRLLQRGNRLSILPVTREEFDYIKKLGLS
jgi:predicted RNA-binding protein with PUA-like domain